MSLFMLNTIQSWINIIQSWVLKYKMITNPFYFYFSWSEYLYSFSICLALYVPAINSSPNSSPQVSSSSTHIEPQQVFPEFHILGAVSPRASSSALVWTAARLSFWCLPSPSSGILHLAPVLDFCCLHFIASSLREKRYTFSPPRKKVHWRQTFWKRVCLNISFSIFILFFF